MKKVILFVLVCLSLLMASCGKSVSFDKGTQLSEDRTKTALAVVDLHPDDDDKVYLIYTGVAVDKTWDEGVTYDREHVWPVDILEDKVSDSDFTAATRDMHNIRACNPGVNNNKANYVFADREDTSRYGRFEMSGKTWFYPSDEHKGDVARIVMYMAKVWDLDPKDVGLSNEVLIEWHEEDPIDQFEIDRNNAIADTTVQGNRNPFIDDEDLAYVYFEDAPKTNLFIVWIVGLAVYIGLLFVIKEKENASEDAFSKETLSGVFVIFTLICLVIWKWWIILAVIALLAIPKAIESLKKD
jgi:endonuclease I